MGRLVQLWKIEDTPDQVIYLYGNSREQSGQLWINKKTGEMDGTAVPGMDVQDSWIAYGMLARHVAEKLFAKGEYPDEKTQAT